MKISNPRMLAGNTPLATQTYVNNVSGNLSTAFAENIKNLSATVSADYVSNSSLFKEKKINPDLLPPISITDVIPINL
jgi:hypothetical protein